MQRITLYGAEFNPVPFRIPDIPKEELQLPGGAGDPVRIACTTQGHVGTRQEIVKLSDDWGLTFRYVGWVFPVMGAVLTHRLWHEWALLDGTLSRTLHYSQDRPVTFDEACAALVSTYQTPTLFGLQLSSEGDQLAKAN